MSNQTNYKKQQNLSFAQFLAETPAFVAVLVSALLSRTILVFVFGLLLRLGLSVYSIIFPEQPVI